MSTGTKAVTDPNLAAINQAFAPPQSDVEGSNTIPNFMDSTQRNAILENPETFWAMQSMCKVVVIHLNLHTKPNLIST